jgi:hypothetical protein
VASFGSKQKDSKHLKSLFAYLGETINNVLTVINIDEKAITANSFVTGIGLQQFITQYEMELNM